MVERNQEAIRDLLDRMRRIEGQARGVQRMLEGGSDCDEILVQLAAMRAALNRVGARLLSCEFDQNERAGRSRQELLELLMR